MDTTVLVHAVGDDEGLATPARRLIEAVAARTIEATTTAEVVQEFAHIRARRRGRRDAAALGRRYLELFAPLVTVEADHLVNGLKLFAAHPELGAFDAVLAATALANDATAFVSADSDFAVVPGLRHVAPGSKEFDALFATG